MTQCCGWIEGHRLPQFGLQQHLCSPSLLGPGFGLSSPAASSRLLGSYYCCTHLSSVPSTISSWVVSRYSLSLQIGWEDWCLGASCSLGPQAQRRDPCSSQTGEGLVGCPHLCSILRGSRGGDSCGCTWSHHRWCIWALASLLLPVSAVQFLPLAGQLSLGLCYGKSNFHLFTIHT